MKKTLKNVAKSIRISEFTLCIVESVKGDGFNQKFERLVYDYSQAEKDLQERLNTLRAEEARLVERVDKLNSIERSLKDIKYYLDSAKRIIGNSPIDGQLEI